MSDESIEFVDREVLEKAENVVTSEGAVSASTPEVNTVDLSNFRVRIVQTPREACLSRKDGKIVQNLRTKVIQLYPMGIHCDAAMHAYVGKCVKKVMGHIFRIEPEHQDYKLEWLGDDEHIPIPSYCIQVVGLSDDSSSSKLLMKAAVLINELLDKRS